MSDPRRITYDWSPVDDPPGPGDVLFTVSRRTGLSTGTCYSILTARRVAMREDRPFARMAYTVVRVDADDVAWGAVRAESLVWHPRRRL